MTTQRLPDFLSAIQPIDFEQAKANLERARSESRTEWLNEHRDAQNILLGIPNIHANSLLSNWQAEGDGQVALLRVAKAFVTNFRKARESGASLVLSGTPGTGKSHLLCAIAKAVAQQGFRARYLTAADLIAEVRETWGNRGGRSEREALAALRSLDLLLVDEIAATVGSADELRILSQVVCARYDDVLPMVMATNMEPGGLRDALGDRAFSRVLGKARVEVMDWADHRLRGKNW